MLALARPWCRVVRQPLVARIAARTFACVRPERPVPRQSTTLLNVNVDTYKHAITLLFGSAGTNGADVEKLLDSALNRLSPTSFLEVLVHMRAQLRFRIPSSEARDFLDATINTFTLRCLARADATVEVTNGLQGEARSSCDKDHFK